MSFQKGAVRFLAASLYKKMKTKHSALPFFLHFGFLITAFLIGFVFFSCSDIASGYVYEKASYPNGAKYMYISLESGAKANARTLTASAIDFSDKNKNYCFYIWGESNIYSLSPRKVDFNATDGTTGTIELNFPVATQYTFTLAVTQGEASDISKKNEILKESIFIGYSNADLTNTNTVKFYLSDVNLSGYGSVNVGIILDDSWSDEQVIDLNENYIVTFGLYYIKSGALLSGHSAHPIQGLVNKTTPFSTESYYQSIEAGTYNFAININKKGSSTTYSYSDRIIVASNREVNATVYLPNIVERPPVAPKNFKVAHTMNPRIYYEYNGETGIATRLSSYDNVNIDDYNVNGYGLLFKWSDESNNETYFKITLVNLTEIYNTEENVKSTIASIPNQMTNSDWESIVGDYETYSAYTTIFDENYAACTEYVGGSVEQNSTQLILYVPFGNCYIAKIQAVNDAGESAACYVSFDLGSETFTVTDEKDTESGASYTGNAFMSGSNYSKVINRYKIVYYLNGGTLFKSNDTNSGKTTDFKISYHTYGETAFFCPTATVSSATSSSPALIYYGDGIIIKTDSVGNIISRTPENESLWHKWTVDSYFGTDLINIVGGTEVPAEYSETGYPYQKPDAYTGYTSLYLFARYD